MDDSDSCDEHCYYKVLNNKGIAYPFMGSAVSFCAFLGYRAVAIAIIAIMLFNTLLIDREYKNSDTQITRYYKSAVNINKSKCHLATVATVFIVVATMVVVMVERVLALTLRCKVYAYPLGANAPPILSLYN